MNEEEEVLEETSPGKLLVDLTGLQVMNATTEEVKTVTPKMIVILIDGDFYHLVKDE